MSLLPWNEHPHAPALGTILCKLEEIPGQGGHSLSLDSSGGTFNLFILWDGEILRAYINGCTHFTGTPLNPNGVGDFLDPRDPSLIYCRVHGARFSISSGACVEGECDGEGLQPVPVSIREKFVVIG